MASRHATAVFQCFAHALTTGGAAVYPLVAFGSKRVEEPSNANGQVANGHVTRVTDEDIQSGVLELVSANVATTYITCPADKAATLGVKLPYLVMVVRHQCRRHPRGGGGVELGTFLASGVSCLHAHFHVPSSATPSTVMGTEMEAHESTSMLVSFAAAAFVNTPDSGMNRRARGMTQSGKGTRMLPFLLLAP